MFSDGGVWDLNKTFQGFSIVIEMLSVGKIQKGKYRTVFGSSNDTISNIKS